jgi:glycosyltransferase involved in cell wall biosynthesis
MLRGEELADAYANGDILVLTSEAETYSQVLFEGLASSLPVVVPNKGAFVDLVKHGQFGYKYKNDDSLISYVNKLVKDTALRDQMGKVAMSVASNKTWQKETEKLIKMYRLAIYLNQQANPKHKLEQISIASLNLK